MGDQRIWHSGMVQLKKLRAEIPAESGLKLAHVLARYRRAKEDFAAIVAEIDAASICCECAGQCCQNGKYRINVIDALGCLAAEVETSADFVQKPLCPYGTDTGCSMEPGLRPADCILFICDALDLMLSRQAGVLLAAQEQVVRECIQSASELTGEKMGTPLLLWAEKINVDSK